LIRLCATSLKNAEDFFTKFAAMIKLCSLKSSRFCHRLTAPKVFWETPAIAKVAAVIEAETKHPSKEVKI